MVQHSGPDPRIWEVQKVFVTFLKLYGPVPRLMAGKTRVQEVIRRIRHGPHRGSVQGPRQHTTVPTLEGVGTGCPPPSGPLHLRVHLGVHARLHRGRHEETDPQRSHRPEHTVDPRVSRIRCKRRRRNHKLPAHPTLCVQVVK